MIDVSQRTARFPGEFLRGPLPIRELVFHIQGVEVQLANLSFSRNYSDMAEAGVAMWGRRALSIWDRLKRKPAPIGTMSLPDPERLIATFWGDPLLLVELDLSEEQVLYQWKETLTMVRAAGFAIVEEP